MDLAPTKTAAHPKMRPLSPCHHAPTVSTGSGICCGECNAPLRLCVCCQNLTRSALPHCERCRVPITPEYEDLRSIDDTE